MEDNKVLASEIYNTFNKDNDTVHVTFNNAEFDVYSQLDIKSMYLFIKIASDIIFGADGNEYSPEIKQFAIDVATIMMYTNIEVDISFDQEYDLFYKTDVNGNSIIDVIIANINTYQYEDILEALDIKVDLKAEEIKLVANSEIKELMVQIELMKNEFEKLFDGVNVDEISEMLSTLTSTGFDEAKVVQAIVDSKK